MRAFVVSLALCFLSAPAFAQLTVPDVVPAPPVMTPAEVVEQVTFIEQHPFDLRATQLRPRLYYWVARSNKVKVTVCTRLMPWINQARQALPKALLTQALVGNAAFQLTHPKATPLEGEVAGLESMLRTYAIVRQKSDMIDPLAEIIAAERAQQGPAVLKRWTCSAP